ncbi:TraR/DksA C4-type zinc finger protein [Cohnella faecalis]|uniref:Molecular chaperone DnaK n=1 Tax=Cohnella faecalis TaxID=2315694 RepID=A0A398CQ11_9BACL|nr:TraR/DksA C4-type zinc finger protein [Cohnella faecalis]RIE04280.1 molecular chaperone DnaK [Cohnella faecalis]
MTDPLTDERMQSLRNRLILERNELERRVGDNDRFGLAASFRDSTGELSGIDNHPADVGTELFERSKDIALLEKETFRLERVSAALSRMETGEYGRCAACGAFISYDRLDALPTAIYCLEHEPRQDVSERRPVEETFLSPPFGRTSLDDHDEPSGFDGEDAWQIVESWGNSDSPAMAEGSDCYDYSAIGIEADENDGFVEPLESFLATDITGNHVAVIRNREYRRYMASREGDPLLEPDELVDDYQ